MTIIALDHFVITVTDLNKSKNFYHEILGLPIVDEQNGFVSLQCGDQLIRLRKKTNGVNAIVARQLETGVFDFCLQTDQPIKNVIAKYKSNNQEIISGPVEKHGAHGKMTSVYTRDPPDGNLVEEADFRKQDSYFMFAI